MVETKKTKKKISTKKAATRKAERLSIKGIRPVLLQVLPTLESGGVERGTIEIAIAAKADGFVPLVASAGGGLVVDLEKEGIEHIELPLDSKNVLTILLNILRLKKIIRKYKVDIIHARSRAPAWSAYFATKNDPTTHFITTFHGTYSMGGPFKRWYNSVMVKGERVIAISEFIRTYINRYYDISPKKITVVHRGVDLEYFDPKKIDAFRIGQIERYIRSHKEFPVILVPGRFSRWKGQDFVLRSLAKLPDREWTCIFLGKQKRFSRYGEELQRLKSKFNLRGNVTMIEPTSDMPAAYRLASLVISSSQRPEAFGRVAIEAQAMGTPVIATDLGGSRETIINHETGRLVDNKDEEGLTKLIEEIFSMPGKKRSTMARKARKHVEKNFSLGKMQEKTIKIYKEILSYNY